MPPNNSMIAQTSARAARTNGISEPDHAPAGGGVGGRDGVAVDPAFEDAPPAADVGEEANVGRGEAALLDPDGPPARGGGADEGLELLVEVERGGSGAVGQDPAPLDPGWNDPQVDVGGADSKPLVRPPFAHVEFVADHAGAGAHLAEDPRAQPQIDLGGEIEGEHVGLGERGFEQILAAEGDAAGDPGGAGVRLGFADPGRIDVDAEAAGAEAAGGGDQDPAVAGAEVDHMIAGPDLGEAEHGIDHLEIGCEIGRVELGPAGGELAGVEIPGQRADLRRARRAQPEEDQREEEEYGRAEEQDADRPTRLHFPDSI